MSAIFPILLTEHVLGAVNDIRRSIMPARLPNYLYHYTREEGFQGIVKSRNLRASCAVSLNDKSSHASFGAIPLPNWVLPQPVQPRPSAGLQIVSLISSNGSTNTFPLRINPQPQG